MATSRISTLYTSLGAILTRGLSSNRLLLANIKTTRSFSILDQATRSGYLASVKLSQLQHRNYAYDSSNKTHKKIHDLVNNKNNTNGVFVFMKGVPSAPSCGYSDAVCQVLKAYEVEFESYDVLSDDELRREVKSYADWPTIPQVYINGSFVGGCDTLLQMHQSGELEQMFKRINK